MAKIKRDFYFIGFGNMAQAIYQRITCALDAGWQWRQVGVLRRVHEKRHRQTALGQVGRVHHAMHRAAELAVGQVGHHVA